MSSQGRDPVSVLLPTIEWTVACEQLAAQLGADDELLVICDSAADPIADREPPGGVEIVVAGEPTGCSGKANAVARGMELAEHDRFVWTDADFERDSDWLERLVAAGEASGPATAIPFFYGGGWWSLVEAWSAVHSSFSFYVGRGVWGGKAWGGGVTFTREDVDVDELVAELRTVLSDDGLLSEHLGRTHPVRSMVTPVEVPGDFDSVAQRQIRFTRLTHLHEGLAGGLAFGLGLAALALLFPLPMTLLATLFVAGVYLRLGVGRWTFLLAFPGLFVVPVCVAAGILLEEFEWAGRRYRFRGARDVEVLSPRT